MSRKNKQPKNNAGEEIARIATEAAERTAKPAQYSTPTPEHEDKGFKQRREHRLIPAIAPLTPRDW